MYICYDLYFQQLRQERDTNPKSFYLEEYITIFVQPKKYEVKCIDI